MKMTIRVIELLRRAAARIPPQYLLLLLFGLLLGVLRLIFPHPIQTRPVTVSYSLYMMGIFVVASVLSQARHLVGADRANRRSGIQHALAMVRDWLPFVLCLWVYENLHDLTRLIRPDTVDDALARADAWLFGVQPTLWLQHHQHPLLTDYMALSYMTYFVFPPLLAGWLYFKGHVKQFSEFQLGLLITFYVGFLGYIIVPAVGPQVILKEQYEVPMVGRYFFWHAKQVVLTLRTFPRDCFPSLHTAVSSVTLFFFLRNLRRMPIRPLLVPVVTVLTISLWISTVYLRYHWVVDVFAGWGLAALASVGGIALQRFWPTRARPRAGAAEQPQDLAIS